MGNKKVVKIRKFFTILMVVSIFLSILSMSPTASENKNDDFKRGYNKGYSDGKKQGKQVCKQYGSRETLVKIPTLSKKHGGIKYSIDYKNGYDNGFKDGYHKHRYRCLKNKK